MPMLVWWWWILPAVIGVAGVVTLLAGLGALFGGRPVSGLLRVIGGAGVGVLAGFVALAGMNVQTYSRLTYERPVATIELEQIGPQHFTAHVELPASPTHPDGSRQTYDIRGDEWRVEARVLKWRPWANVLGLDSQYQLDRLSGRYVTTEDELNAERSAYDLRPSSENQVDLWALGRRYDLLGQAVDSLYGSGAAMPMSDGARYEVWITQSGLIARAVNPQAETASEGGWR
jgi:hypothetical protein